MRVAVISDIHGNPIALDAVLDDARATGAQEFWFVGDFAGLGPQPVAVLERVTAIPGARFARGNSDRYVVTGENPPPSLDDVRANPDLIPVYANIAASLAWTRGFVTGFGWFGWLESLPLEIRHTTKAGIRILAVHASPGTDDGEGIHAAQSDEEVRQKIGGCEADLVLVGHTHEPVVRRVDGVTVVNLGSISNPKGPDPRASYAIMEIDTDRVTVRHRRVAYDHAAFARSVHDVRHPAADFLLSFQKGDHPARAPHPDQAAGPALGETILVLARDAIRPLGERPE